MFHNFSEIETYIKNSKIPKKIALAGAQDINALEAVVNAKRKEVISAVLVGDSSMIVKNLHDMSEPVSDYEIISCDNEHECAQAAVALVKQGKADIPMKGLMQTASYMRAILHKADGLLPEGALLSEATVFFYPKANRFMIASDCAVNIAPSLDEKVLIVKNAVLLAQALGIERPKVAVISAQEQVNPKISSSVDAGMLADMDWADCLVQGPLALDNAVSPEAAKHKGIQSEVAGDADILLLPDLCSGNVLHKSLHYFADYDTAGALCGTTSPVIMTSRTDSSSSKYNSILIAILQSAQLR